MSENLHKLGSDGLSFRIFNALRGRAFFPDRQREAQPAPKHHAARLRLIRALTHYQRAEPARHVGIHCGDACQEHRSVFIDPARLIGIVLFCADARSAAPITAFEISH
jgi:hypothetical protein